MKVTNRLAAVEFDTDRLYRKAAFVLGLFVLYSLGFRLFYPAYAGTPQAFLFEILVTIPVLAAAYYFGLRVGLAAWVGSIPLEVLLLAWCGASALQVMVEGGWLLGMGILLVSVIPAGRLHDLRRQIGRNSTDRQKADQVWGDSQRFIQQVMEHIPDIVYIHDLRENRNVYVNKAITSVLGYTPEAVGAMGSAVDDMILHPDDLASISPDVRRRLEAAQAGEIIESQYRVKHASGEWHWFATQEVVFIRHDDGSPRQLLGIAQDISERKMVGAAALEREKLQLALEKERELSQLKNHLMVTLSHEFRTPLSVIMASGELLERYFERLTPTRRTECLTTIKTQIMHLREMLDDITTLVGQGETQPRFNPSPTDLAHFYRGLVEEFQASLGAAYTIQFQADGELDAIPVDTDLLRPVFKNLLSNAVKYSHKGGTVQCNLSRRDDYVLLQVIDQGIGIPADDKSRIFETFHRASNVSHIGGLGMGLRIVRDYIALHQGTVEIESEEGKGTTVTVRLPVR